MSSIALHGGPPVRRGPLTPRNPFAEQALTNCASALATGNLSSVNGPLTLEFERQFAQRYGAAEAVAVSSGTAAIHTAVATLDPKPGGEVIIGPITDAGSVLPVLYQGCIPVFCDLDQHLAMTPDLVEPLLSERTVAIMVIHLFGGASDVEGLRALADRHGIALLEDCSQAHATTIGGRPLGRFGEIGMFSLQQSKHLTTGDGGICLTDDPGLARRMRLYRDKGWDRTAAGGRAYPQLGLNYRITELQSAVGLPQLDGLDDVVCRRRAAAARLDAALAVLPQVEVWAPPERAEASYWCYPFFVPAERRDAFAEALAAEGVPNTPGYIGEPIQACLSATAEQRTFGGTSYPLSLGDGRDYRAEDTPVAAEALRRMVVLWTHEDTPGSELDEIAEAVAKVAAAVL